MEGEGESEGGTEGGAEGAAEGGAESEGEGEDKGEDKGRDESKIGGIGRSGWGRRAEEGKGPEWRRGGWGGAPGVDICTRHRKG